MSFLDRIAIDPEVQLTKGNVYPFIDMSSVSTTNREPDSIGERVFSGGGARFQHGDTVIARIEPCLQNGKKFFCHGIERGFGSTEYLVFRPKDHTVDPLFLYYYMQQNSIRQAMINSMVGSTGRQRVNNKVFLSLPFDPPDIEAQTRIGSILSAYDSLIETNQRQIKLLEEAAQRLYREWFVDLRFPGHEDVPVVDGVPEGWKRETVGTLCTKTKDTVAPENIPTGTPYIGLEHIPRHDFCLSEWGDSSDVTSSKAKYAANDIIFGQIRPYFHKVGFALNDGVASTDSFIMTPRADIWGLFLLTVFSDAFVSYTYQTCKEGAKMPRADWNQMKKYPILVADNHTQALFEDRIGSLAGKVRSLALQDHLLSEARDRLLPKLMSGDITI